MAQRGLVRERTVVPDFTFGLALPTARTATSGRDRSRHYADHPQQSLQTSFEQKSRSGTVPFTVFGWPRRTPILARDFLGAERMTVPKRVQSGTVRSVPRLCAMCSFAERPHNRADSGTIAGVQKLAHQGHLLHRGNYSFDHLSLFERTVSPSGNRL